MTPARFTTDDAQRANNEWGANCGPGAIAVVSGLTLRDVRPFLGDFERKRYTNPTLMWEILNRLDLKWRLVKPPDSWPSFGLVRVQWEGPWTSPGVPARVAYRHTHWIAADASNRANVGVFDINCGWTNAADWAATLVPWLLKECEPKASGEWHFTHVVEIDRPRER